VAVNDNFGVPETKKQIISDKLKLLFFSFRDSEIIYFSHHLGMPEINNFFISFRYA
jgi:hypothetical protein